MNYVVSFQFHLLDSERMMKVQKLLTDFQFHLLDSIPPLGSCA